MKEFFQIILLSTGLTFINFIVVCLVEPQEKTNTPRHYNIDNSK